MAEKKLNIGNLVTPNGASLLFGAETTPDNLEIMRDNEHTWNPYTIVIDEETDESVFADMINYIPAPGSVITANDVQGAINQLADSLENTGGTFYAIYGVTPFEDIVIAYNQGKSLFALDDTAIYVCVNFKNTTSIKKAEFDKWDGATRETLVCDGTKSSVDSQWNVLMYDYISTDDEASTTAYGITKLSTATNSTATNLAATPSAVKAAYDLAASKTSNTGTITEVKANGTSVATSGVANIPAASTSAYGVTKLNSATNSTSTSEAATASAVKAAYDLAASKTSNTGTITKVQANGTDIASSGTANIPAATSSAYGVTKLNSATNSTSGTEAATPAAVKAAYDLAASKGSGTITKVQANGTDVASSGTANIPAATTSAYGVTKLSSSTSSTSTALAATPSAVKSAYDLANAAMPKGGGTFTGAISYSGTTTITASTAYYRPIRVSTSAPKSSDGNVGDIWIQYS